ncbi:MAG: hypothetical protein AMJ69_08060 [Gammaproteobacteria bacterium SG8_47]|nr:MAG: hypothetical protein AMJ69_08060 [Gammaproteobacteria bacterium SG8_47]
MLWLSLYLPQLARDVFLRGSPQPDTPLAVMENGNGRQWVAACNHAAQHCGIAIGMSSGAVYSLCQQIQVQIRDPAAELEALRQIALWAQQFTSLISLSPPHDVLLEIQGSLMLFGGLATLRQRIEDGLTALGYQAAMAIAPTPLAARWLARAGYPEAVTELEELSRVLRQLPVTVLMQPPAVLKALHGIGVRRIGECLRLPRAELTRRFGKAFLLQFDQALGDHPDPQAPFEAPAHFASRLSLPSEVDNTEALLFAARRLLVELVGFLRGQGCGVQRLQLDLYHRYAAHSHLPIGLVSPSRDAEHLIGLFREHLSRFTLPAPVEAIALRAESLTSLSQHSEDLFTTHSAEHVDWPQLCERLQARLGPEAVRGICPVAEHRPEYAWRYCAPGETDAQAPGLPRPSWLLNEPLALRIVEGRPWFEGPLQLVQGPERIESGWWDGLDVRRDYFIAESTCHARYWIYRELPQARAWYLHGLFG